VYRIKVKLLRTQSVLRLGFRVGLGLGYCTGGKMSTVVISGEVFRGSGWGGEVLHSTQLSV